ncbi:beta-ketoacyl-[acyl-carrier-protein] synthase family protein [Nonomuraea sp. NPDC049758]|uniref:beta-ketoacyl-[acyl-carrier-protein] synthase family protein n=1 Tax=Nonomuraea sp. NPDC049758 TaxID=3154360 RepID=UPI003420F044
MRPRVAVTGLGLRTPAGSGPKELWNALLGGRSTARAITSFDTSALAVRFACQVPELDVSAYLTDRQARRLDRASLLAVCAAGDALADAGHPRVAPERRAVVAGSSFCGTETYESALLDTPGPAALRLSPIFIPKIMPNAGAAAIGMRYEIRGPSMSVVTACASGAHAIGEGVRLIRDGSADLVVAGAGDANVTPGMLHGFSRCRALSVRNDDPEAACRPFEADRDGFVLAEGAAFLVLERLDDAVRRGARVHAEVSGYGRTSDAHDLTAPAPGGEGARRCMDAALADAGLAPEDIVHVNAHGTGTELNDLAEAQAIGRVFGPAAVPVSSTKGVTGHALGASGAIEAVACVLAMAECTAPPTANLDRLDPRCDIDAAPVPRPIARGPVMSNSFGFGGHNATLVFSPAR